MVFVSQIFRSFISSPLGVLFRICDMKIAYGKNEGREGRGGFLRGLHFFGPENYGK